MRWLSSVAKLGTRTKTFGGYRHFYFLRPLFNRTAENVFKRTVSKWVREYNEETDAILADHVLVAARLRRAIANPRNPLGKIHLKHFLGALGQPRPG